MNYPTEGKSEAFKNFIESFNVSSRETSEDLDIQSLQMLEEEELSLAKSILVERLKSVDDHRVPKAIVAMNFAEMLPNLKQAIPSAKGKKLIECLQSCFVFTKNDSYLDQFVQYVKTEKDPYAKIAAIMYLEDAGNSPQRETSNEHVLSKETDIRVRNVSVQNIFGRKNGISEWIDFKNSVRLNTEKLALIYGYAPFLDKALKSLNTYLQAIDSNEKAIDSGLVFGDYSPEAKDCSTELHKGRKYTTNKYLKLENDEKNWAILRLLNHLEENKDFKALEVLVAMDAQRAGKTLYSFYQNSKDDTFRLEILYAILRLSKNDQWRKPIQQMSEFNNPKVRERALQILKLLKK